MRAGERAVWIRSVLCVRKLWHAAGWAGWSGFLWLMNGHLQVASAVPFTAGSAC